jgi:hypothetical protein
VYLHKINGKFQKMPTITHFMCALATTFFLAPFNFIKKGQRLGTFLNMFPSIKDLKSLGMGK